MRALLNSRRIPTEPSRHPLPHRPAVFVKTQHSPLFYLPTPDLPGSATLGEAAYLPGLEPEAPPTPALLLAMSTPQAARA